MYSGGKVGGALVSLYVVCYVYEFGNWVCLVGYCETRVCQKDSVRGEFLAAYYHVEISPTAVRSATKGDNLLKC